MPVLCAAIPSSKWRSIYLRPITNCVRSRPSPVLKTCPDARALLRMGRAMVNLYCESFQQVPKRPRRSDTSNLALAEAIKLAKERQAALRLVQVVDETPVYITMDTAYALADYQKAMREAGQKLLTTSEAAAREAGVNVDTKFLILHAPVQRVCDAVNDEAKRWPADVIVIGTHGRHGFNHLLLGSVAEGVIRLAAKPVLVIRGS